MTVSTTSQVRWVDFSGAPPIVIPRSIASLWHGTTDPATEQYREVNVDAPYYRLRSCLRADFLLMNSAADGQDLRDGNYLLLQLDPGRYAVEFCDLEAESFLFSPLRARRACGITHET